MLGQVQQVRVKVGRQPATWCEHDQGTFDDGDLVSATTVDWSRTATIAAAPIIDIATALGSGHRMLRLEYMHGMDGPLIATRTSAPSCAPSCGHPRSHAAGGRILGKLCSSSSHLQACNSEYDTYIYTSIHVVVDTDSCYLFHLVRIFYSHGDNFRHDPSVSADARPILSAI